MEVGGIRAEARGYRLPGLLLFGAGVFNIVDYYVTGLALQQGFAEGNPLMAQLVGTASFAWVKLALVPLLLLAVWLLRGRVGHRLHAYAWLVFCCYGSLMLYFAWLLRQGLL